MAGFNSDIQNKESDAIKKAEEVLMREQKFVQQYESRLMKELKEIKDMDHNFKIVISQMETLRKLFQERKNIFKEMLDEYHKKIDLDIEKFKKLNELIQGLDTNIFSLVNTVDAEIPKLIVYSTTKLYADSDENKRIMEKISSQAQQIQAEVASIKIDHGGTTGTLNQMVVDVQKIEEERKRRPDTPSRDIGFER